MADKRQILHGLSTKTTFDDYCSRLQDPTCRDFAVELDAAATSCAVNLSLETVRGLLEARAHSSDSNTTTPCFWINLWGWSPEHEQMIKEIAKYYHISPRLAQSLCPKPSSVGRLAAVVPKDNDRSPFTEAKTLEEAGFTSDQASMVSTSENDQSASFSDVFNAVWHFCTVDFGRRYMCIGWNALFFLPHTKQSTSQSQLNAIRIWSSLLLCDDGTVISVFENPPSMDAATIKRIRKHQVNVFRNLSQSTSSPISGQNNLMYTAIRNEGLSHADPSSEMASLLFYYLFDDWLNLYEQVSGSKYSYRHQLELLRKEMMEHARQDQINTLHQIGRQLSSLRSICRSYRSIIEQVVSKQRVLATSSRMRPLICPVPSHHASLSDAQLGNNKEDSPSADIIRLPLGSVARFERLIDRIDLCAMNEVEECLKEKEALVQMNFHLVSFKEAQTVERLTRTTILLAKVTILFLPISLATSYFSMQLPAIESVSLKTYWLTFMVVTLATILFLGIFEFLSARYSGKLVYRSLFKMFFDRRRRNTHQ